MADNLKEIFEEAGEFAEAYELGLNAIIKCKRCQQ